MIDKELSTKVVDFLNELLELDRKAITNLVNTRVKCNDSLAAHDTVQVMRRPDSSLSVGLIGLLNGLCGAGEDGWGDITVIYEDVTCEEIIKFQHTSDWRKPDGMHI